MTETTDPQPDRRDRYATAIHDAMESDLSLVDQEPGFQALFARAAEAAVVLADAEQAELRQERDLAVAHDRQPYPTAWAYEQACAALNRKTEAIARVRSVLESEAVVGRSALDYRGLITSALMADDASGPDRMADEAQQQPCAECDHPYGEHQEGDDPVTPGTCSACTDDDRHDYEAQQPETQAEIVHGCPPDGSGITPCCGRTPFELPPMDRMSADSTLVTCQPAAVSQPDGEA